MNLYEENLANIIKAYPQLIGFLNILGIKLGFGDKSTAEVCAEYGIPHLYFLELMQLVVRKYDFNPNYFDNFELKLTLNYLKNSHKVFLAETITDIELSIKELIVLEPSRDSDCKMLFRYFEQYKKEVIEHFNYEDKVVFPYIENLELFVQSQNWTKAMATVKRNPIIKYIEKHNSLEEQLDDLKNLLIKYYRPFDSYRVIAKLLKQLFELEQELQLHELIENRILFPQVQNLEKRVMSSNNLKSLIAPNE